MAEEEIEAGEFIIEYVGEGDVTIWYFVSLLNILRPWSNLFSFFVPLLNVVIDDKTCEERLWNMKNRGETNFYLCEITIDKVIDATHKGNKSRYINHSCNPNTQMQKWFVVNCQPLVLVS